MEGGRTEAEALALELSHDLMSPYCPGRTISTCPSPQARELEADILAQARAGRSREQIEQILVDRFGGDIVGYGNRPVVLYGSAIAGLVAAILLAYVGRRWVVRGRPAPTKTAGPATTAATATSAAELDAVEDELDRIEEF
jgi:cytochrome c-type biogenesis protein CcmH/NrfF